MARAKSRKSKSDRARGTKKRRASSRLKRTSQTKQDVKKPKKATKQTKTRARRSTPATSRIEKLRAMLEAKRMEILENIRKAREDSLVTDRASYPEDGDLVSASLEKEKAFEYCEIGVNALREIELALEKLDSGTYGICEICGKPIGMKRLMVVPTARLCIKCKAREEEEGRGIIKPET